MSYRMFHRARTQIDTGSVADTVLLQIPMQIIEGCLIRRRFRMTTISENEWSRYKYMQETLSYAMQHSIGLTEAGAETPWVDAANLLAKVLEPDVQCFTRPT